jgi:hypothetical protein
MKLIYFFSEVYNCYCDFKSSDAVIIDNRKGDKLNKKIEKRIEYDEELREHVKTVFHCDVCQNKNNRLINKINQNMKTL